MSKTLLAIVGILVVLMGIAGFVANWLDQPTWYSIVQIIIGAVAVVFAVVDKK